MNFNNLQQFVGGAQEYAGNLIHRAKQMTEEACHSTVKTPLDPELEGMYKQADDAKTWTEKIIKDTGSVLTPNTGQRIEDYFLEKMDQKPSTRQSNMEVLGQGMLDAGNEFGPDANYGSMLIKVGTNKLNMGQTERAFIIDSANSFVEPMNRFLENEVKNSTMERNTLENKRLDLDAAKHKLAKANSSTEKAGAKQVAVEEAEREVNEAQLMYDQQAEKTKAELQLLIAARDQNVESLKSFVKAETAYYSKCHQLMVDLNKDLEAMELQFPVSDPA